MNSHHLILGDGVIGQALADELASAGQSFFLASRHEGKPGVPRAHHRCVDALDGAQVMEATAMASHVYLTLGVVYDARIWADQWPRIMAHVLAACRRHRFTLVFFDNVYAYGPSPLRVPMREDHPQLPSSKKGQVRKQVNDMIVRAVQDEGLPIIVARCADFYGPKVRNAALYIQAIERQLKGQQARFLGDPDALHTYTYTVDAARAMVCLGQDPAAVGQTWHLPSANPTSTRVLLDTSARHLGAPVGVSVTPRWLLRGMGLFSPLLREVDEMLYQFEHNYVLASDKFMRQYPSFRVTPFDEGIKAMLDSFKTP